MSALEPDRRAESDGATAAAWSEVWPLAIVFGLVSVPWTYGFVAALEIPLWPAFVASATYFAADAATEGGSRTRALVRSLAVSVVLVWVVWRSADADRPAVGGRGEGVPLQLESTVANDALDSSA